MDNNKDWEDYWKNENTELIHFIGKDNIVFHCIIFPIILKVNNEYNLPANVPANEFLNLEGKKLSTSKNWAIWLNEFLKDFEIENVDEYMDYPVPVKLDDERDSKFRAMKDLIERKEQLKETLD